MSRSGRPADAQLSQDLHVEATYRLTEALVEADNRMRRRLELLAEVVFETDAAGVLVYLNPAWVRTLERSPEDCLGHTLCSFVVEADRERCLSALRSPKDHAAMRPRIRLLRADGEAAWFELSAAQLAGGGVVGALHDITAEKLAKDEISKLSLVASYTDNLVIITDREGRTEWVNRAFIDRTGFTLADMLGRKPGDLLQGPATDRATVARIAAQLAEGRSFKAELLNYTKSGQPYWVILQITPIRNAEGVVERFVSVQTDSTELWRTQRALEAAKDRAESASEAKTQFLATISHEMRTPLNVILGSTDIALDGARSGPMQPHLERIHANAEILLRLISDMLDVSKIEAGQFDFERIPVKVRTCIQSALVPIVDRARAKGLDFRLMFDDALPAQIMGDPDRLRQIVTNLAENAVKFTDTGFVRVEIARAVMKLGTLVRLEIRVVDSGVGIALDAQTRIFERFEQSDSSTTRRKGGAGLGLNIVKSLVEAMGGRVTVESAPGNGADFRVLLPLDVPADTGACPTLTPGGVVTRDAARPATILVAEDTDANFAVLEIFLSKAGYRVTRAGNGREAIRLAPDVDLILMDVEMPEIDGLEATRQIRAAERSAERAAVPILALTAHAVQGYRERCLSAGCTGYLSKPIRRLALLDAVGAALDQGSASEEEDVVLVDTALAHLAPAFVEHCRKEQAKLRDAIDTRNWGTAARVGHNLKGAGPSIGFLNIGRLGCEIEAAALAEDTAAALTALEHLSAHLKRVRIHTA